MLRPPVARCSQRMRHRGATNNSAALRALQLARGVLGKCPGGQHQHRAGVVPDGVTDPKGDFGADAFGLGGVVGLLRLSEDGEAFPAVAGVDADGGSVAGPDAGDGAGGTFDVGRVDVVAGDDDDVLGAAAHVQCCRARRGSRGHRCTASRPRSARRANRSR